MPIYSDPIRPADSLGVVGEELANARTEFRQQDSNCIHIGLVNNMPSSALDATERQFRTLLGAASDGLLVRLTLYALPEIPRVEAEHISARYADIEDLWSSHLDGLIVTGAEPLTPILSDEPYWGSLAKLVEWAQHNTSSAIWSCLAGHAAVLQMDGIKRHPLGEKLFGIFECAKTADHPAASDLTTGLPDRWRVPHSRWHDLPGEDLEACGYEVLARSENAGVDTFIKRRKSLSVFFQGHPEYEAESLWLEYRRDMRRFLRRESEWCPSVPYGYLDEKLSALSSAWRQRALSDRCESALAKLPFEQLAGKPSNTWHPAAVSLYRNWLLYLRGHKPSRRGRLIRGQDDPIIERSVVTVGELVKTEVLGMSESGRDNLSENGGWSAD